MHYASLGYSLNKNVFQQTVPIKKDHILPQGDSIEEINERNKMGELLYQGDIVLTKFVCTATLMNASEVERY